jgi:recombination protein RecR
MRYPNHLIKLIETLKRLPGVGNKSAERFAFHLLGWKSDHLKEMADTILAIPEKLRYCSECGCLRGEESCFFCGEHRISKKSLCVIASARDAFSIEETQAYKGLYHVLGVLLSPLDGIGPEKLNLNKLKNRIELHGIEEVILALDSTVEGDATSLYIKQELGENRLQISRLAFGVPVGSSLDYVDGGTLAKALSARGRF